jgi:hypothetical protein
MGLLTRSDLQFSYSWLALLPDDPKVSGTLDNTPFNRDEGYEVLYLINAFAAEFGLKQKDSGLKIERMIKNNLPASVRNQANVKSWLQDNWERYH